MSKEAKNSSYSNLIFRETFSSEGAVRSNGGTPTNVIFNNGVASFNSGLTSKIVCKKVSGVKSIRIILKANTTTQNICKLSSSHSISVSSGTISATGLSSPSIYVNGLASSTLSTNKSEILITTATAFNATDFQIGYISSYFTGEIELLEIYKGTLTASEVANLYNNTWNKELPVYSGNNILSNLISNSNFSTSTGWTAGTNWSISGGVAIGNNTYNSLYTTVSSSVINKKYKVVADITVASGTLYFQLGTYNVAGISSTVSSSGQYIGYVTYISGTQVLYASGTGFTGTIDNIALYEVNPTLLLDFNSSQGILIERTGKTLTATDVTYKKIGTNYSAKFNGTTSKIDCGSDLIGTKAVTVCGWINSKSWGESNLGEVLNNGKVRLAVSSNKHIFSSSDGTTLTTSANTSISLNKWYFISITRSLTGVVNFYIGNKNIAPTLSGSANQSSGTPVVGTTNVFIGNNSGATRTFDGFIQQLKVYDGILDLATITQIWSESLKDLK